MFIVYYIYIIIFNKTTNTYELAMARRLRRLEHSEPLAAAREDAHHEFVPPFLAARIREYWSFT